MSHRVKMKSFVLVVVACVAVVYGACPPKGLPISLSIPLPATSNKINPSPVAHAPVPTVMSAAAGCAALPRHPMMQVVPMLHGYQFPQALHYGGFDGYNGGGYGGFSGGMLNNGGCDGGYGFRDFGRPGFHF